MDKSSESEKGDSNNAVQIIAPIDHSFELKLDVLNRILEDEKIKDYNVVVVSIDGAFRKGKSFLLNFFLKYLNAQYKTHDVSDWIGENKSETLNIFSWRGGQKPETIGLWMWPEIFTHTLEDGKKVAIVLVDTQGLFDDESSMKDCIATFALSTLISSVQCFNIMQQVQEDQLQHLDLFTQYGRLVMEQSDEKPFQQLLFIIRVWKFPYETPYGYNQEYIDKKLTGNSKQTPEMHELRERIRSSFDKINAYLMPDPGSAVARSNDFNGNLDQIEPDFIQHLKELIPSLLAPENLVVKKINGQKLKPVELIAYLEEYVNVFNGEQLPDPQSVLMATATANIKALFNKCLKQYSESMQSAIQYRMRSETQPYFSESILQKMHHNDRAVAKLQFEMTRKLGGEKMIKSFTDKLLEEIEDKYISFKEQNETNKNHFNEMADKDLQILHIDCYELYMSTMEKEFGNVSSYFEEEDSKILQKRAWDAAMTKFEQTRKHGADSRISEFKTKLEDKLNEKFDFFKAKNETLKANYRPIPEWAPAAATIGVSLAAPYLGRAAGAAGSAALRFILIR